MIDGRAHSDSLRPFDLVWFATWLNTKGWRLEPGQVIAAQTLMLSWAVEGKLDDGTVDLPLILRPIFCTNADEQGKFDALYAEWCRSGSTATATEPSSPERLGKLASTSRLPLGQLFSLMPLVFMFAGVGLYGLLNLSPSPSPWPPGRKPPVLVDTPKGTGATTVEPPDSGKKKPGGPGLNRGEVGPDKPPPRQPVASQRLSRLVPLGSLPRSSTGSKWWWVWSLVPLGVWALMELVPVLWAWLRGDRWRADLGTLRDGDREESVPLPQIVREVLPNFPVRQTASTMRTRIDVPGRELDLNRTIKRTIARGGLPHIVTGSRRERSFVVLADRRHVDDHQAHLASLILKGLCDQRVDVDLFWFDESPEYCFAEHKGTYEPKDLHSLLTERPSHLLLIFGTGDEFFDRSQGTIAPWIELIRKRVGSALLTTVPMQSWTNREWLIERNCGVRVLPLDPKGLQSLGQLWSDSPVKSHVEPTMRQRRMPLYERNLQRLLERDSPPRDVIETLFQDLQKHLDPVAFQWLCSLAVYPQVQWGITIWLGRQLFPEQYEALISQLAQLIWLRKAYMPTWFRRELIERMPPELEKRVREELTALLKPLEPGATSPPPSDPLEQFVDRLSWVIRSTREARTAAPGTPTRPEWRDAVFIDFMSGRLGGRTTFDLPQQMWRLVLRPGRVWPSWPVTTGIAAALSVCVGWWTFHREAAPITVVSVNRAMNAVVIERSDGNKAVAATPVRRPRMLLGKLPPQADSDLVTAHKNAVSALAMTRSGQLISGASDQTLKLWNLDSGALEVESEPRQTDDTYRDLLVTSDRSVIAFSGRAERWSLPRLALENEEIPNVFGQISVPLKDGQIATVRKGAIILLTPEFVTNQSIVVSRFDLTAMATTADSSRVVAGDMLGGLYLIDPKTGSLTIDLPPPEGDAKLAIQAIAVVQSPVPNSQKDSTEELAVVASGDGSLRVWDLEKKALRRTIHAHAAEVSSLVGLADGRVVSGSSDGTLKVWDPRTGEQSLHLLTSAGAVTSLALSDDPKTVVAGTLQGTIELFDIGTPTAIDDSLPRLAAVDAAGSLLIERDWRGRLRLLNRQTQLLQRVIPAEQSSAGFRVSPDGKWIVTWGKMDTAYVWSVSGSDPPTTLSQLGIRGAEWVRDGESDSDCLLTWGSETRLIVWYPAKSGAWPAGPHEDYREGLFRLTRNLSFEGTPEHVVLNTARTSAYVWDSQGTRAWMTFPGEWDRTVMSPAQGLVAGIPKSAQISKGDRWILETRGYGEGHLLEPGGKIFVTFEQQNPWTRCGIYQDSVWGFSAEAEGHLSFYDLNDIEAKKTVISDKGGYGTDPGLESVILPDRVEARLPARHTITGVHGVTASPHDDLLCVVDHDGSMRLYSIVTGSPITDPVKLDSPCLQVKFCEDQSNLDRDQLLCSVHADESVHYWLHERVGRVHALLIDGDEPPLAEVDAKQAAPKPAQTMAEQLADGLFERFGAEASVVRRDDIDAVRMALTQSRWRVLPDDLFIVGMTGYLAQAAPADVPPAAAMTESMSRVQYVSFLQPVPPPIVWGRMEQAELAQLLVDHPCRTILGFFEEPTEYGPPAQGKLPGMTRRLMHDTVDRAGDRASVPSDLLALLTSNDFQGPRPAYQEDWYESTPWPAAGHSSEGYVYFPGTHSVRPKIIDPLPEPDQVIENLSPEEAYRRLKDVLDKDKTAATWSERDRLADEVVPLATRLTAPDTGPISLELATRISTERDSTILIRWGAALGQLSDKIEHKEALAAWEVIAQRIVSETDPDRLKALAAPYLVLSNRLDPKELSANVSQLISRLKQLTDDASFSEVASLISILLKRDYLGQFDPQLAHQAARLIVLKMDAEIDSLEMFQLGNALWPLSNRLEPFEITPGGAALVRRIKAETDLERMGMLASVLGTLGEKLEPQVARSGAAVLLERMTPELESSSIAVLGLSLGYLSGDIEPQLVRPAVDLIVRRMEAASDASEFRSLTVAIASLNPLLDVKTRAHVVQLVNARLSDKTLDGPIRNSLESSLMDMESPAVNSKAR